MSVMKYILLVKCITREFSCMTFMLGNSQFLNFTVTVSFLLVALSHIRKRTGPRGVLWLTNAMLEQVLCLSDSVRSGMNPQGEWTAIAWCCHFVASIA